MKKKLFVVRYYILIFFISLLTACSVGDSVRVVQMSKVATKGLLSASDSLPGVAGNPADIMVLDSLLLVRDGEQLVICNTDSRESRTLFGRGRGPGEMLGSMISHTMLLLANLRCWMSRRSRYCPPA